MESIKDFIEFLLHFDKYLGPIIRSYGTWTYAILFLIIFCETAMVVTNFLPGDVLLFTAGTFAAWGFLDVRWLIILLGIAAIAGDSTSYWIGRFIGLKLFNKEKSFLFNRKYLDRTHWFYKKYGVKTILISRFVPMLRSFAPFVAGIGYMKYKRFALFNIIGVIVWDLIFVLAGYFFGRIPLVRENFSLVLLFVTFIVIIPILPGIVRLLHKWY